jgi:hypothetical protein
VDRLGARWLRMIVTARAPGPTASTRLFALAAALAVTVGGGVALWSPAAWRDAAAPRVSRAPLEVVLLRFETDARRTQADAKPLRAEDPWGEPSRAVVEQQPVAAPRARPRARASTRPAPDATRAFDAITQRLDEPGASSPRGVAEDAPTLPARAAPAPAPTLDLSKAVIDSAVRRARSPVRAMGQASGAYVGTDPISKDQALAASVARSAKPDCIGTNAQASLLSIVTLVANPLLERCSLRR